MKFYKDTYLPFMVPEWSSKYIDYLELKLMIKEIKQKALQQAQFWASQHDANRSALFINIEDIDKNEQFMQKLNNQIETAYNFYLETLQVMASQFNELVQQAVKLKLIDENRLKKFSTASVLEYEIGRRVTSNVKVQSKNAKPKEELRFSANVQSDELQPLVPSKEEETPRHPQRNKIVETVQVFFKSFESTTRRRIQELQEAFMEYYRGIVLLRSFCTMNSQAIRKILKKYDKHFGTEILPQCAIAFPSYEKLHSFKELQQIMNEAVDIFAIAFYNGEKGIAMQMLRVPVKRPSVGKSIFRMGLYMGFNFACLLYIIYLILFWKDAHYLQSEKVIRVFRALGMIVLIVWGWSVDVFVWTRNKINYVFIFEFNMRKRVRYQHMFEAAALMTLVWAVCLIGYLMGTVPPTKMEFLEKIPWQSFPLSLFSIFFVVFVVYQFKSRFWLLRTLARIFTAPLLPVLYRDFFIADQLVSLAIVLQDVEFTFCFFSHGAWVAETSSKCIGADVYMKPILAALPSLLRALQCLRRYMDTKDKANLINAGKYSSNFFVVGFSAVKSENVAYQALWLCSIMVATVYSFSWDIIKDWGLGDKNYGFLRKTLLYRRKGVYYSAIVADFFLRFLWTLTISPFIQQKTLNPLAFQTLLAAAEICRRCMWNLFRLEFEQLSNSESYRAVNVVVPPIVDENSGKAMNWRPLKWFK